VSTTLTTKRDFQLQFAPVEIPALARRYMDRDSKKDQKLFAAGARIRSGDLSRDNLWAIFRWKTKGRGVSRLARNTDDEIADALKLALQAKTERSAIAVLTGLNGVDVPMFRLVCRTYRNQSEQVYRNRYARSRGPGQHESGSVRECLP
jgi:hypothetical protein